MTLSDIKHCDIKMSVSTFAKVQNGKMIASQIGGGAWGGMCNKAKEKASIRVLFDPRHMRRKRSGRNTTKYQQWFYVDCSLPYTYFHLSASM